MAKNNYYVVWVGKKTGIFTNWSEVQPLVTGHPGSKFKGFVSKTEAEAAYASAAPQQSRAEKPKSAPGKKKPPKAFTLDSAFDVHIFTDGACIPNPGVAGSGLALYRDGRLSELWYGCYEPQGTNNTAELNALHQALLMAEQRLAEGLKVQVLSDSSYSVRAMNDWAANWKRNGWVKRDGEEIANVTLIADMYELFSGLKGKMSLVHVKGHAGIEGNELADRLSFLARIDKIADFVPFRRLGKDELLAVQVSASA